MIKQKNALFVDTQKQKQLSMKGTLMMMYLNKSILLIPQLYQTYKILEQKVQAGSLIQSEIVILKSKETNKKQIFYK